MSWRVRWFLGFFALVLCLVVGGVFVGVRNYTLTPTKSFGAPLRIGNRVYLLTGQWRSVFDLSDSIRTVNSTDLFVDFWAFDASTSKPVFRRRLQTIRNGAMWGRSILGAQNNTIWLLLPTGIHAVDRETGSLTLTPAQLEEKNPQLQKLLPVEPRFFLFSGNGLSIKTGDARTWYIHPDTFVASESAVAVAGIAPAYFTPQATHAFLERGITLGKKWLGLLNEKEDPTARDLDYESRRALYSADISQEPTFFGPKPVYSNLKPLTKDFLGPGLLAHHRPTGHGVIVFRRDPDSVFIMHRDRLGENGHLQLARIAGPAGNTLWNATLPLSVLQAHMPGEESLVLYGVLYRPDDPNDPGHRDPMHDARELLVALDWKTGKVSFHDQSDTDHHPEAK